MINVGNVGRAGATLWLSVFALVVAAWPRPAAAQQRSMPIVEIGAGALMFADDGIVTEGGVGGASRFYISSRVSIGPEIVFVSGERHSHLALTGNATLDLTPLMNGVRPLTPFIVVGGGLFQTRERFPNSDVFTHSEGAFTGGGGIRALAGQHLVVGAEARLGWELHFRIDAIVGIPLR